MARYKGKYKLVCQRCKAWFWTNDAVGIESLMKGHEESKAHQDKTFDYVS